MNKFFLGDLDEKARAHKATRQHLKQDDDLMYIQSFGQNAQIDKLQKSLYKLKYRDEKGKTKINEEFPVNGVFDMIILRARDQFIKMTGKSDLQNKLEQIRILLQKRQQSNVGRTSSPVR